MHERTQIESIERLSQVEPLDFLSPEFENRERGRKTKRKEKENAKGLKKYSVVAVNCCKLFFIHNDTMSLAAVQCNLHGYD